MMKIFKNDKQEIRFYTVGAIMALIVYIILSMLK